MTSLYERSPLLIDPFVLHFLSSSIQPPPPLPSSVFFFDPFLVVPTPPPVQKTVLPTRHRYTPLQLFTLHRIFIQLPYPSLHQRRLIAQHLKIDIEQVRIWFSNRRSRQRVSNPPANLQPTSNEYLNLKTLFNQLNLVI